MGRHRHAINVRADGLEVVLGALLRNPRVTAAALVDVDSGMVLDSCGSGPACPEPEVLGAGHAELMRVALGSLGGASPGAEGLAGEVVLSHGGRHHVVRLVPDPYGDRLALSVVVDGPRRVVERTRRQLREVSAAALTAGPTVTRRPPVGGWTVPVPAPRPAPAVGTGGLFEPIVPAGRGPGGIPVAPAAPAPAGAAARSPAPPSALPPGPRRT